MPKSIYTQLTSLSWVYHGHLAPSYPAGDASSNFSVGVLELVNHINKYNS